MEVKRGSMNILGRPGFPRLGKRVLVCLLSLVALFAIWPQNLTAQDAQTPPPNAPLTPEQLQQLVAPIALYPDSLVAQILAASTFPEQVVEADRWVQAHPDLHGDALGQGVDQQSWDPSVKALSAFPSVLGNMDKNLSWTSSLGDAYYNQQPEVMDAIQVMRQRAQAAGNLQSTPQQTVDTEDSTVVIQPASPDVVYVPAYDPWLVYGDPIVAWPGWYPYLRRYKESWFRPVHAPDGAFPDISARNWRGYGCPRFRLPMRRFACHPAREHRAAPFRRCPASR